MICDTTSPRLVTLYGRNHDLPRLQDYIFLQEGGITFIFRTSRYTYSVRDYYRIIFYKIANTYIYIYSLYRFRPSLTSLVPLFFIYLDHSQKIHNAPRTVVYLYSAYPLHSWRRCSQADHARREAGAPCYYYRRQRAIHRHICPTIRHHSSLSLSPQNLALFLPRFPP